MAGEEIRREGLSSAATMRGGRWSSQRILAHARRLCPNTRPPRARRVMPMPRHALRNSGAEITFLISVPSFRYQTRCRENAPAFACQR